MRSITRQTDVSINTVAKLLNDVGDAAKAYHDEHVRRIPGRRRITCSQTWAFSYPGPSRGDGAPRKPGNTWTFLAIDADSRLIVACLVGNQGRQTTAYFVRDVRRRFKESPRLSAKSLRSHRDAGHEEVGSAAEDGQAGATPPIPTNSEKRRLEKHVAMINLYALHYNFCRVHPELAGTPAMEAGLDEVVRDAGWIVELVDARASKPNRPKTYRKRGANSN